MEFSRDSDSLVEEWKVRLKGKAGFGDGVDSSRPKQFSLVSLGFLLKCDAGKA
jgi:hypothetical protein